VTDIVPTVFALTALLALISLLLPLADRLAIPYAVLLAGVGCAIGITTQLVGNAAGVGLVGDMIGALDRFDLPAEALLYIFLPVLLFETALNIDVQRLTDEIAPILLLAVVGVLVATAAVGVALWGAFSENLLACLMLGAVVATTDPVAVVAIFRDIGAPRRLTMLVEGEALFNDAAAIALYGLLLAMVTGVSAARPLDGLVEFLREFAGGLAVGFVAGRGAGLVIPALRNHRLAETTFTIALAYLIFVVSQRYLFVSGVVAVVTAGLAINHEGHRRLSPSSWKLLVRTWEQLGFWATSLIFLLAAMMVPAMLSELRPYQLLELALLIVAAFAARGFTLFALLPLLSRLRLAASVRHDYKLVMLWGGMRGAVSLALALAATQNANLAPEIRQMIGVLASGFILFTLFIGAPTLRPLMRLLKLDQLSPADIALRDRVTALQLSLIGEELATVAREHDIAGPAVEEAMRRYTGFSDAAAQIAEENAQLPAEPRLRAALAILIDREHELYLQHFEVRAMSRRALARLMSRVAMLRDAAKAGGLDGYRGASARIVGFSRRFRPKMALQRWLGIAWPLAGEIADRFEAQLTARLVLRELRLFNKKQLRPLFGDGPSKTIDAELARRLAAVVQAAAALGLQYPVFARALEAQFLTLRAIAREDEEYRRLRSERVISLEVFNDLVRDLDRRRGIAEQRPRLDLGLERLALIERVPIFAALDPRARRRIARLLRPRLSLPDEIIVRKGERGDSMYFISSGAVEVRLEPEPVRLGTGDFFGEMALLHLRPRNADVVALGYCRLLRLAYRDLNRMMRADAGLYRTIETVAGQRLEGDAGQARGAE
jgi:CPA1 family monovalent cation:H+ antiporter